MEKERVASKTVDLKIKIKVDHPSLEKIERRKSSSLIAKDGDTWKEGAQVHRI